MAKKVAHPEGRGKHKKQDRLSKSERRVREQERRAAWVERWAAVAKVFIEGLLQADVDRLLGRPVGKWGDRNERVEVDAECNKCHRKWRGWFRRNGTYPRSLTIEGVVVGLAAPRLRCHCGGSMDFSWTSASPCLRPTSASVPNWKRGCARALRWG